jgi:hypothetical protein
MNAAPAPDGSGAALFPGSAKGAGRSVIIVLPSGYQEVVAAYRKELLCRSTTVSSN